jgi:pimeloyl-ACP methyl ester carboxylesterase
MPVARLPGVLLHYVVLNPHRARPRADVVLVHGLGASLGAWYWTLAPALAASNRVVSFDLRGHGLSSMPRSGYTTQAMADDLKAQLDFLGIDKAHLVGHSFGGRVILNFASKYPERARSLTLADVLLKSLQPRMTISEPYRPLLRAVLAREAGRLEDDAGEAAAIKLLEALARMRVNVQSLPRGAPLTPGSPFAGVTGRRCAMRWLRLLEDTTARDDICGCRDPQPDQLQQLELPTLLVYGEHSHAAPTAAALRDLWPHARSDTVPRAGHFFPVAFPDRLLGPVGNFIEAQH